MALRLAANLPLSVVAPAAFLPFTLFASSALGVIVFFMFSSSSAGPLLLAFSGFRLMEIAPSSSVSKREQNTVALSKPGCGSTSARRYPVN
jgi:hypothetical protein